MTNIYDGIVQKFMNNVQNLAKSGENNNGKIDTAKEEYELANLLSGAKNEIENIRKQEAEKAQNDRNRPVILQMIDENANKAIESLMDFCKKIELTSTGRYKEKISGFKGTSVYFIRDAKNHEIGRKAYSKNEKYIYTNKDDVARRCGLKTKKDIENIKSGFVKRTIFSIVLPPVAKNAFRAEDSTIDALGKLNDDEAMCLDNGKIYKWDNNKHEYKVVGSFDMYPEGNGEFISFGARQ